MPILTAIVGGRPKPDWMEMDFESTVRELGGVLVVLRQQVSRWVEAVHLAPILPGGHIIEPPVHADPNREDQAWGCELPAEKPLGATDHAAVGRIGVPVLRAASLEEAREAAHPPRLFQRERRRQPGEHEARPQQEH